MDSKRRRAGLGAAIGVVLAATAASAVTGAVHHVARDGGPVAPGPDPATLARLRSIVRRDARFSRDPNPDSVLVYATTRRTANAAAFEADVGAAEPVYLVVARGHFVAVGMSKPSNDIPDATGHIMRIVWEPRTQMVADFGIGDNEPDTSRLGPGFSLDLSASS